MPKFRGTNKEKRAYWCDGWIKPNERIRMVLDYRGELKPLFWFRPGVDGSLYFAPRAKGAVEGKQIKGQFGPGETKIDFSEGTPIPAENLKDQSISYHSSGIMRGHSTPGLHRVQPLEDLKERRSVALLVFQHPTRFQTVKKEEAGDIICQFPGSEAQPLWCQLYMLPLDKHSVINVQSATEQVNASFRLGSENTDWAYELQAVLCCGPAGPWPEYTTALVHTVENDIG